MRRYRTRRAAETAAAQVAKNIAILKYHFRVTASP